jgi:low affinity Fe/Cu permease
MVFLIQHTQNRDSKAIHLKLDELLQKNGKNSQGLVNVEDVSDDQLETMHQHYKTLHEKYEAELKRRKYVA